MAGAGFEGPLWSTEIRKKCNKQTDRQRTDRETNYRGHSNPRLIAGLSGPIFYGQSLIIKYAKNFLAIPNLRSWLLIINWHPTFKTSPRKFIFSRTCQKTRIQFMIKTLVLSLELSKESEKIYYSNIVHTIFLSLCSK